MKQTYELLETIKGAIEVSQSVVQREKGGSAFLGSVMGGFELSGLGTLAEPMNIWRLLYTGYPWG